MNNYMKALVLTARDTAGIQDVPVPDYAENEILIRTKAATICTSDLHDLRYNPFDIALPVVMGHEGAGVVEAVGSSVTEFCIGDEVAVHPVMPCRKCPSCLRGLAHLCDDMEHLALNRSGAFAEYFVSRPDCMRKKPSGMSFAHASLMEPVSVCLEALDRGNVKKGCRVLILGDGPFGILMAKLCAARAPKQVILTGRHDYRLSQATGAHTINEKQVADINREIMDITGGEGVDSAILCVSNAAALDTAVEVLRSRGTLSVFSAIPGKTSINMFRVHVKELTIAGSCNDDNFMDEAMNLLADPTLAIGSIITHEFPFAQWQQAFEQAEKGKDSGLKVSMML